MTDPTAPHGGLDEPPGRALFPIREVSRVTGINPVTLRAWERRYGLVQPIRTDSGHRLYSQANIDEVQSILGWIERGVAVSKVGPILARQQVLRDNAQAPTARHDEWKDWQTQLLRVLGDFDESQLQRVHAEVLAACGLAEGYEEVMLPVWWQLRREPGYFGQASEWLLLDSFLRKQALLHLHTQHSAAADTARTVLLAAIDGECRELELLVTGVLLGGPDLHVRVLPLGQPLDELGMICAKVRPRALVLYSNHPPVADTSRRWARLGLALECPLLLVGEAAEIAEGCLPDASVTCLGANGRFLNQRLQAFLAEC